MAENKRKTKRVRAALAVILCAAMIAGMGVTAFAADTDTVRLIRGEDVYSYALSLDSAAVLEESGFTEGEKALTLAIKTAIWNGEPRITFSGADYGVTFDSLSRIVLGLFMEPETFAMSDAYYGTNGDQLYIAPVYNAEMISDYDAAKAFYLKNIDEIVSLVDEDWSDVEKILFVNEYFALNYEYDLTYKNKDAYTFFRDKKGVCQAYMRAFEGVMQKLGIEASYVESKSMEHSWNIVKADGNWYHIDLTWNDPVTSIKAAVDHDYFLLSTDKMVAIGHFEENDWGYGENVECSDTTYDNYFWRSGTDSGAVSAFKNIDGRWYFISREGVCSWDGVSSAPTVEASFATVYEKIHPEYSFTKYVHNSGLEVIGGRLYLNSAFDVIEYDISSKQARSAADVIGTGVNICSCFIEDGSLYYQTTDNSFYRLDISVYTEVPGGGYGYYVNDGRLTLRLDPGACVIAAWYGGDGAMKGCRIIETPGQTAVNMPEGAALLISLDSAGAPRCEAVQTGG